jgi:hypothetical protein
MVRSIRFLPLLLLAPLPSNAATLRVPQEHPTIQAACEVSQSGDTILVAPGTYQEHLQLPTGVVLRSEGDDAPGVAGLRRAEATILDGGKAGDQPGVVMAEGSRLDGFTITNVGSYDEARWRKHFDSHGEELDDDEGAVQAEGTVAAVQIHGVSCTVANCIVHHNGDVGISILGKENAATEPRITGNRVYRNMGGGIGVAEGAEPIIRRNACYENLRAGIGCRNANPIITHNACYQNVRAGIGCREGARPVVRNNTCYQNRRAGIGVRMAGTAPVVEDNECYENEMAGIGCRDGAAPIVRNNLCRKNRLAGIGCQDGAQPLIVANVCQENEQAGIGVQSKAQVIVQANRCVENKLVAIGVTDEASAVIVDNELSRTGSHPPIIAVREGSTATIRHNRIAGGGVAALLVQGQATVADNTFVGVGPQQGNAVWVWENSSAAILHNTFDGYATAVHATKAAVIVADNSIKQFQTTGIVVKDNQTPAHVYGNAGTSKDPRAKIVDVQGAAGVVANNIVKQE